MRGSHLLAEPGHEFIPLFLALECRVPLYGSIGQYTLVGNDLVPAVVIEEEMDLARHQHGGKRKEAVGIVVVLVFLDDPGPLRPAILIHT